jgi:hypothetical protein
VGAGGKGTALCAAACWLWWASEVVGGWAASAGSLSLVATVDSLVSETPSPSPSQRSLCGQQQMNAMLGRAPKPSPLYLLAVQEVFKAPAGALARAVVALRAALVVYDAELKDQISAEERGKANQTVMSRDQDRARTTRGRTFASAPARPGTGRLAPVRSPSSSRGLKARGKEGNEIGGRRGLGSGRLWGSGKRGAWSKKPPKQAACGHGFCLRASKNRTYPPRYAFH